MVRPVRHKSGLETRVAVGSVIAAAFLWGVWSATAADRPVVIAAESAPVASNTPNSPPASSTDTEESGSTLNVSHLDINDDARALLAQARDYLASGNHREALLLLQHVIDHYPDSMTHYAGPVYRPARRCVERMLRQLPPEAMTLYRLSADSGAQALLGGPIERCRDISRLKAVYERFFVSSLGDDAGFRYACLLLDRGRPAMAANVLTRVLRHPSLTVDRSAILRRLVLARLRLGDRPGARAALQTFDQQAAETDPAIALLAALIHHDAAPAVRPAPLCWPQRFGSDRGEGRMAELAYDGQAKVAPGWAVEWRQSYPLKMPPAMMRGYLVQARNLQSRQNIARRWAKLAWMPADQVLFDRQHVYLKSHDQLLALDRRTGQFRWSAVGPSLEASRRTSHVWRTYHTNSLPDQPITNEEVALFGNRVGKSISLIDGAVYFIANDLAGQAGAPGMIRPTGRGQNDAFLANAIVFVDATSGKRLGQWGLSAGPLASSRFLNAPVATDHHLVAPLVRGSELFLAVFDRHDRRLLGKPLFLCDLGKSGATQQNTVAVAAQGDLAYVCPGVGVIFCVDLAAGRVAWASVYPQQPRQRSSGARQQFLSLGSMARAEQAFAGWEDNAIFISGSHVLVCPTDSSKILAVDRLTGQPDHAGASAADRYPVALEKPRMPIALSAGKLFIATEDEIQCYQAETGQVIWKAHVEAMTGRAALAGSTVYVPTGERICRLDARSGKRLEQAQLAHGLGSDPVGNLVSDGDRLFSVGLARVYALAHVPAYLDRLNAACRDRHDGGALLKRALLHRQFGRLDEAAADLRLARAQAQTINLRIHSSQLLFDLLLELARTQPTHAADALAEADSLANDPEQHQRLTLARADFLSRHDRPVEAAGLYLKLMADDKAALLNLPDDLSILHVAANIIADENLNRLLRRVPRQIEPLLNQYAADALARARRIEDPLERQRALWHVVMDRPQSPAALEALRLAVAGDELDFGIDEAVLKRLIDSPDAPAPLVATALLALADRYAERLWTAGAVSLLIRVRDQFGDQVSFSQSDDRTVTAGQLAEAKLARLADETSGDAAAQPSAGPAMPARPWKLLWQRRTGGIIPLELDGDRGDPFAERYLLVATHSELRCLQSRDGRIVWRLPMGRGRNLAIQTISTPFGFATMRIPRDGHILITHTDQTTSAYSMVTGKSLWSETSTDGQTQDVRANYSVNYYQPNPYAYAQNLSNFVVGSGIVAHFAVDDQMNEQIRVRDVMTGRLLWNRRSDGLNIRGLTLHGDLLCAMTDSGTELLVFNGRTGQLRYRLALARRQTQIPLVWTERGVIYLDDAALNMIDLSTGKPAWKLKGSGWSLVRLLDPQTLALIHHGRQIQLVDPDSGKVATTATFTNDSVNLYDMALTDDGSELFCMGISNRGVQVLGIFDRRTGKLVQRIDMDRQQGIRLPARLLARCGELIPCIKRKTQKNHSMTMTIAFYRRSDGKSDESVSLPLAGIERSFRYINAPPILAGGLLIVPTYEGLFAFGHDPASSPDKKPSQRTVGDPAGPASSKPQPTAPPRR